MAPPLLLVLQLLLQLIWLVLQLLLLKLLSLLESLWLEPLWLELYVWGALGGLGRVLHQLLLLEALWSLLSFHPVVFGREVA